MTTEIKQTRSTFKVVGKVTGLQRDDAFKEAMTANGSPYARLRFGVKTSETQTVYMELFGMQPTKVYLFKNEDGKRETKQVEYGEYLETKEELEENGYRTFELSYGFNRENGKLVDSKSNIRYLGILDLWESALLQEEQDVTIIGDIQHSTYVNKQNEEVQQTRFVPTRIYATTKPVDFEDENFKEVATFDEEIIFSEIEEDKREQHSTVYGYTVDYTGKFTPTTLTVDWKGDLFDGLIDGTKEENIEIMKALSKALKKEVKFGQRMKINGKIVNRAELSKEEDDNVSSALFGKSEKKTFTSYTRESLMLGVTDLGEKYEEDDVYKAIEEGSVLEVAKPSKTSSLSGLSGKASTIDNDDTLEIDDEDLPF